jgi:hypothetical protein
VAFVGWALLGEYELVAVSAVGQFGERGIEFAF